MSESRDGTIELLQGFSCNWTWLRVSIEHLQVSLSRSPILEYPFFDLSHLCVSFFSRRRRKRALLITRTTLSNGYLGSGNDEERSEMRYVVRIAEFSESSNLRTQIALLGHTREHVSSRIN